MYFSFIGKLQLIKITYHGYIRIEDKKGFYFEVLIKIL